MSSSAHNFKKTADFQGHFLYSRKQTWMESSKGLSALGLILDYIPEQRPVIHMLVQTMAGSAGSVGPWNVRLRTFHGGKCEKALRLFSACSHLPYNHASPSNPAHLFASPAHCHQRLVLQPQPSLLDPDVASFHYGKFQVDTQEASHEEPPLPYVKQEARSSPVFPGRPSSSSEDAQLKNEGLREASQPGIQEQENLSKDVECPSSKKSCHIAEPAKVEEAIIQDFSKVSGRQSQFNQLICQSKL